MSVAESILYLTEADVQQTLTIAEAVELAEKGIQADAAGRVAGDKFYMPVGEAGFIKPFSGYLLGESLAFVKTFNFFPNNPARLGRPRVMTGLPPAAAAPDFSAAIGLLLHWARGDEKLGTQTGQRFLRTGTGYFARVGEWFMDNF